MLTYLIVIIANLLIGGMIGLTGIARIPASDAVQRFYGNARRPGAGAEFLRLPDLRNPWVAGIITRRKT